MVKGVYDVAGIQPGILATGSARLNTTRKTGDSLAGRFFGYRQHPFDIKEVDFAVSENGSVRQLIEVKTGDKTMSANLGFFRRVFPGSTALQLVVEPKRGKTFPDGSELRSLVSWLADISL